ncbi:unnamed protein product [Adineta steineri]|uniref:GH18 domain-containing protein n=1 Tax=Adineta steineri TaxID=433720 RepID=A0A814GI42_9BILA|nr:unnamed protein product [Adineta steineri]CAF3655345.1 unnamed protein product [Adineta steineri]
MFNPVIIVAYYAAWSIYSRSYFVTDIPGDKITHINYAFANIGSDGRIALGDPWADVEKAFPGDTWDQPLRGNFNQLIKLKQKYSHIHTLISIGGWTWSGKFSDIAVSSESRNKFAQSCVEFIRKYSFDGVDIDWEYPVSGGLPGNIHRPEDKQNYVLLLKELRQELDKAGQADSRTYLLTVATGAGTERIADMDVAGMSTYLDWINVMTYDFHAAGGWESKTGHNAPLFKNDDETTADVAPSFIKSKYNCHEAIQGYIAAGTPRSKLIMGLGLYGRGWQGVSSKEQNGFSQSASSQPPVGTWENGVFDYDHIKKSYLPTYTRYWDDQSKVPFLYNSTTTIWISYDDVQSIDIKSDYIKREKLAGAMFWELSSDRNCDLVGATFKALHNHMVPSADSNPPNETISSTAETTLTNSTSTDQPSTATIDSIYPLWAIQNHYKIGDQVMYKKRVYQCIQSHKSLSRFAPSSTYALWRHV